MKKILFLCILIVLASCTENKSNPADQIKAYYNGFQNGDYKQIKNTLADSLITTAGDFIMPFSKESYYEKFKWDSIFKPVYKLINIENQGEQAIVKVSMRSLKHDFLKNSPMTCNYKFHFKSGKIAKIENLDCPDANWEVWAKEVDALVNWVKTNHPELDGFINDLTMKGAMDYMKAIALYKEHQTN